MKLTKLDDKAIIKIVFECIEEIDKIFHKYGLVLDHTKWEMRIQSGLCDDIVDEESKEAGYKDVMEKALP